MTRWLPPLLALLTAPLLPAWLARQGVGGVAEGEALGEAVAAWTHAELSAEGFSTGAALFDGEWWFGTYTMAAMGFGQLAQAHPERAARWLEEMDHALAEAARAPVRAFDTQRWGEDPLAPTLRGDHVAYLGYLALPLALRASLDPEGPHAALSEQVFAALEARFTAREAGLLETYPGEGYAVDNCMALGAWGLYAQARGEPTPAWLESWTARLLAEQVDPATGLLIQHADPASGAPRSPPRGSGTALCAYALSFAWPERGRALAEATRSELADTFLGFGVVREYPRGVDGRGDIDSGPVILGFSVSATGFSIADARLLGDAAWEARLLSTARLYGAPLGGQYVTGGPLGNALLLAMSTAPEARR
ncbi:MAG: hypothetical protein H6741_06430 [Alphaproteobacteria bacterium]|nr:hypothetical protein [Alphaproteobacteria bacterium]MCB9792347.1 hypothetical protein [Alphaproteobacteria bacterium]